MHAYMQWRELDDISTPYASPTYYRKYKPIITSANRGHNSARLGTVLNHFTPNSPNYNPEPITLAKTQTPTLTNPNPKNCHLTIITIIDDDLSLMMID